MPYIPMFVRIQYGTRIKKQASKKVKLTFLEENNKVYSR